VSLERQSLIRCSEVEGINDGGSRAAAIQGGLQPMTKLELLYAQKSKKFDQLCIL